MKDLVSRARFTSFKVSLFCLGLFLFLCVYIQGTVVRAADPGSASAGKPISHRQQAAAVATFIYPEDLIISTLAPNTTNSLSIYLGTPELKVYLPVILHNDWVGEGLFKTEELLANRPVANTTANTITLSVAPGSMVDIVLSVVDEAGNIVVDNQNLSPAGEVETIADLSINEQELYEVLISTAQGAGTDYAFMLLDQESYNFVLRGTFFENGSRNDVLAADMDHFWFFNAGEGDRLSLTVTPDLDSDPYIELYNPAADRILTLDETLEGEAESLEDYPLEESGLYSIRIGEFYFLPMTYQIDLSKQ